jgi:hypothetical protein
VPASVLITRALMTRHLSPLVSLLVPRAPLAPLVVAAVAAVVAACSPGGDAPSTTVRPQEPSAPPAPSGPTTPNNPAGPAVPNQPGFSGSFGCIEGCAFDVGGPLLDQTAGAITQADLAPFAAGDSFADGALCVLEPQLSDGTVPGALFPRNWLRPRFRWQGSGSETLWEVRLTAPGQTGALVAYTRDTQWVLPAEIWANMRDIQEPVEVTIRGLAGGRVIGKRGSFSIAPVDAGGSMVFWSTSSAIVSSAAPSRLLGFAVGDEGVAATLTAADVATGNIPGEDGGPPRGTYTNPARPTGYTFGTVECVGCHVSTPDGKAVVFTDNWPWNKVVASIEPDSRGALPSYMNPGGANLLKQPWLGMQAMSPAHFTAGDRIVVTSYGVDGNGARAQPWTATQPQKHTLAWFNLDATSTVPEPIGMNPYGDGSQNARNTGATAARGTGWGLLTLTGETQNAVVPTWSHDGNRIAYVSTERASTDGHPDWRANTADIVTVPYGNRSGGAVQKLAGASDPNFLENYPAFSSDDRFIAFARAPVPSTTNRCIPTEQEGSYTLIPCPPLDLGENPDGPYYNRKGEIWIVNSEGGSPVRLVANDPVSCANEPTLNGQAGLINSWPKWSPRVEIDQASGKAYYFLIFSSARDYPGAFELPKSPLTPDILPKSSQLYMASIVVDQASGEITTYPAIYLWNQNILVDPATGEASITQNSNLTPAWDDFSIPAVPPPVTIPR